jgi:hypothetical protein
MVRSILGTIAGLVVAAAVVAATDYVNHRLHPPSEDIREAAARQDFKALRPAVEKWMRNAPRMALILIPVGWIAGAFWGALIATLLARIRWPIPAIIIASFVLIGTAMNLAVFPHPRWIVIAGLLGIPAAALAAWWLVPRPSSPLEPQPYDMRQKNMAC